MFGAIELISLNGSAERDVRPYAGFVGRLLIILVSVAGIAVLLRFAYGVESG